jgi:hypothetical protein
MAEALQRLPPILDAHAACRLDRLIALPLSCCLYWSRDALSPHHPTVPFEHPIARRGSECAVVIMLGRWTAPSAKAAAWASCLSASPFKLFEGQLWVVATGGYIDYGSTT